MQHDDRHKLSWHKNVGRHVRHRTKSGFTLVELLVVIAIIGILIAMLLPAVQSVREAARNTDCKNRLHQWAIAIHNFESAHYKLPHGSLGTIAVTPEYFSAHAQLLPFIEQVSVYDEFEFQQDPWNAVNYNNARNRLPVMLCPSEPRDTRDTDMGWLSYLSNAGGWVRTNNRWDGVFGPQHDTFGVAASYPKLGAITFGGVTDGLSNTAVFAEIRIAPSMGARQDPLSDCKEFGSGPVGVSAEASRAQFLAADWNNAPFPMLYGEPWRFRGYPWHEGTMWRNWYNHLLPPGSSAWRPANWWDMVSPSTSWHPGGQVNAAFCDGSIRSFSAHVNADVWYALGTRAGQEANTDDQ